MAGKQSKGGGSRKFKRNHSRCEQYRSRELRRKHKEARVAKQEAKTKLMSCGHASRYLKKSGNCAKCVKSGA